MTQQHSAPVTVLDGADAWSRMRSQTIGRLAVSVNGMPDIFPVNFLASEQNILIRTAPGSKLDGIEANSQVAFETDVIGEHTAWSVVVRGSANRVENAAAIEQAQNSPLWTWMPRTADIFVKIIPAEVSGRLFHRD